MKLEKKSTFVAIEGGGTKFVVSVGRSVDDAQQISIPTEHPSITIGRVKDFIRQQEKQNSAISAIGVASFGPVGINPANSDYGLISNTPKPDWSGFNYLEALAEFAIPIVIDSDVNAAALAEARCGAGYGKSRVAYITVGTGVGGGFVVDGVVQNGKNHPELGHMLLPLHPKELVGAGYCPFHGACLEGLASGPSIKARWGKDLSQLAQNHLGLELEAHYLAAMCVNVSLQFVPDVIVLGGGVMATPGLLERVKATTAKLLNGYFPDYQLQTSSNLISKPQFSPISGLVGAYQMAYDCLVC